MENSYLENSATSHVKEELPTNIKQEIHYDDYNYNEENHEIVLPYIKKEKEGIDETIIDDNSKLVKVESISKQEFGCFICEDQFKSQLEVDDHIKNSHHESSIATNTDASQDGDEKIFVEQIETKPEDLQCDDEVTVKVPLDTSNAEYIREDNFFKCSECGEKFKFKCHITRHVMRHTRSKPFKCSFENCQKAFSENYLLVQHIQQHNGVRPFKCTVEGCPKSFVTIKYLKNHARSHNDDRPFHCDFQGCLKRFKAKNALLEHKVAHTNERPYRCTFAECIKTFRHISSLSHHTRKHNIALDRKNYIVNGHNLMENQFKCTFEGCTREYENRSKLNIHIRKHNPEKLFKCDVQGCGASFHFNHALVTHKKRHSGERPHKCGHPGCNKFFKCKGSLWCHLRTHKTEKLFRCLEESCGKSFSYQNLLAKHVLIHTKEKPAYVCNVVGCKKAFSRRSGLYSHARRMHNRDLLKERTHLPLDCNNVPGADVKIEKD